MIRRVLLLGLILGPAAAAQILRGPGLPALPGGLPAGLPGALPGGAGLPGLAQQAAGGLNDEIDRLERARKQRIRQLLRRHADVVEADPNGDPIVRGEVLAYSPTDVALARALSAGFSVVRERSMGTLGIRIVVLSVPRGAATSRALSLLRRLDPAGTYAFNNLYTESGSAGDAQAVRAPETPGATATTAAANAGAAGSDGGIALGLIDGGVGTAQPVFKGIDVQQHGCGGAEIPSAHATEVASLMVGRSARFGGAAPGAVLYAADVYCGKPTGGAVDAIADALEWLAGRKVPIINVSLVGPSNVLLQQVIARLVARGVLIVAAVGNDGPAAPPLYPAAWPGVIGVTAVDARRRVIFEAERGPQVMFAAPGADIPAAVLPDRFETVRGTSFAAPIVAGLLAGQWRGSTAGGDPVGPAAAHAAIDALARTAIHLGGPGRNGVFGYGLVGASLPSPRPRSGK